MGRVDADVSNLDPLIERPRLILELLDVRRCDGRVVGAGHGRPPAGPATGLGDLLVAGLVEHQQPVVHPLPAVGFIALAADRNGDIGAPVPDEGRATAVGQSSAIALAYAAALTVWAGG